MIVKLIRPWNNWSPGMVFSTMQDNVAEYLIQHEIGVQIPYTSEAWSVPANQSVVTSEEKSDGATTTTERGNQRVRRR